MPTARGNGPVEMSQRTLRPILQLKIASSESDGAQATNRHSVDRSPRVGDRRSPRGSVAEKKAVANSPLQKKRSTRISDLESQLGQAQDEIKKLKELLASAESVKKEVVLELEEETKKQVSTVQGSNNAMEDFTEAPNTPPEKEKPCPMNLEDEIPAEESLDLQCINNSSSNDELKKANEEKSYSPISEVSKLLLDKNDNGCTESMESAEVFELKAKTLGQEQELIRLSQENEGLKLQLLEVEDLKAKEEETTKELSQLAEELEESKQMTAQATEKLESVIKSKAELEAEMKRVRVQAEQWRKAAEAATAMLASVDNCVGAELNSRCGNKQTHGIDDFAFMGTDSPMLDTTEDGHAGKRKGGAGIKRFEFWKKKGPK